MKSIESGPIPLGIEAPKTVRQQAAISFEEIISADPDEIERMRRPDGPSTTNDQRGQFIDYVLNATPQQISRLRKKGDTDIISSKSPERMSRY